MTVKTDKVMLHILGSAAPPVLGQCSLFLRNRDNATKSVNRLGYSPNVLATNMIVLEDVTCGVNAEKKHPSAGETAELSF